MSEADITEQLRDIAEFADPSHVSDLRGAADEIQALREELRRFQRIIIDHEILTECDDLCMVLCAGPCQGFNTGALSAATKETQQ